MSKGLSLVLLLFLSLLVSAILVFFYLSKRDKAHKPIWHPFIVEKNITLESVVEDGFSFASMPCGQIQYSKTIADTTIQYEIDIDCSNTWYNLLLYPNIESDSFHYTSREKNGKIYKGSIERNKYYPWDIEQVRNCKHKANYSWYIVNLGQSIDSIKVVEFVEKNQASIESSSNWNSEEGGSFLAYSYHTKLSFSCEIKYQNVDYPDSTYNWVLTVHR